MGWRISSEGKLVPVEVDRPAAPKSLLELARYSCKSGCNDKRCGCNKQGLHCTLACAGCRGVCANAEQFEETDIDSD